MEFGCDNSKDTYQTRTWCVIHPTPDDAEPSLASGIHDELFVCRSNYARSREPEDARPVFYGDLELAAAGIKREPGFRAAKLETEWHHFPAGTVVLVAYEMNRALPTYVLEVVRPNGPEAA